MEEQAARRRAATAQRACRREEQRAAQGGLNARQVRVAVAIFVLSGYDAAIAGEYVLSKSESVADPGTLVRDLNLAMPLDSALRLELPETKTEQQIHQAALKFIAERKTFEHVSRANSDLGVAPSSQDTAAEYLRICDDLGIDVSNSGLRRALDGHSSTPATGKRLIRKWSRSFRKRWGLGFGSLQTQDPMPEPEVAEKAGFSCWTMECKCFSICLAY